MKLKLLHIHKNVSLLFLIILTNCSLFQKKEIWIIAPTRIANTKDIMKSAGYWIGKISNPDSIIMNKKEIDNFNTKIRTEKKVVTLPFYFITPKTNKYIKKSILAPINYLKRKKFVFRNNKKIGDKFFEKIIDYCMLDSLKEKNNIRYGVTIDMCNQRSLPSDSLFLEKYYDIDFDYAQNSTLNFGEPLAILWQTKDSNWLYVVSSLTNGWIKREKVSFTKRELLQKNYFSKNFIVAISPKIDIYKDSNLTQFYTNSRMGTKIHLIGENQISLKVDLPTEKNRIFYVNKNHANIGFLDYTPRNTITQAFKLLNAPYGWGGMYREQDCSRFINEIFSTTGIILPRNSTAQSHIGVGIDTLQKYTNLSQKNDTIVKYAIPGSTILRLRGHIMFYLGEINNNPYIIHDTWAYRDQTKNEKKVFIINKVIVSDLNLGKISKKGSLLKRITTIKQIVKNDATKEKN